MNGLQSAAQAEFELTVEESGDARPLPGFHVTRTRTYFVADRGQVFLLAAPGHRAMLQRADALPAGAVPTRSSDDPDLDLMARAAQALVCGARELVPLHVPVFFAWRTRLFHVRDGEVHELKRDHSVRFEVAAALPAGAVPFTAADARQLGDEVHAAALGIRADSTAATGARGHRSCSSVRDAAEASERQL